MKITILLASVLIVAPILSLAEDPVVPAVAPRKLNPAETAAIGALNKAMNETAATHAKTQQCFELNSSLKSELAHKKTELAAEYKGKIPSEFDDLFMQKQLRIERQHKTCAQLYEDLGKQYESLMLWFRNVEPKSLNVKKQKAQMDAQKEKYLKMLPTTKTNNTGPRPSKAQN